MSTEKTYLQQGGITVTNARFIVDSQTFAMRNITSVGVAKNEPDTTYPGLGLLIGSVLVVAGLLNSSLGIGVIGLGVGGVGAYVAWHSEPTFSVVLTTSAGEVKAYTSQSRTVIAAIVDALNLSIAEGG